MTIDSRRERSFLDSPGCRNGANGFQHVNKECDTEDNEALKGTILLCCDAPRGPDTSVTCRVSTSLMPVAFG